MDKDNKAKHTDAAQAVWFPVSVGMARITCPITIQV